MAGEKKEIFEKTKNYVVVRFSKWSQSFIL